MGYHDELIDLIISDKIDTKIELHKAKINLCKKYKLNHVPPDSEVIENLPVDLSEKKKERLFSILRKKPMRTISGVAVVAVMTSPEICPHGKCIPCPGGPEIDTPQSYTGHEPAAMRASYNKFDPYWQTTNRIKQLKAIGHPVDKIDLILMGGTFTSRLPSYMHWFVKRCLDALNQKTAQTLEQSKKNNESALSRCIGLTVETRPDWFRLQHVDNVLNLGATRVELGVQTVYDYILHNINRGHTVTDTIAATRIAKEAGFKVCYHMMPGLPGSDIKKDIDSFKTIFENSHFRPDMIKIYPTLTLKGTELYDSWKKGFYKPLSNDNAVKLIAKLKTYVPSWVRIQRIQRDIPANLIDAGVDKSNLRQIVEKEMQNHGKTCCCIRCREIGHRLLKQDTEIDQSKIELEKISYEASNGTEIFFSYVERDSNSLIGYLRLRDIINPHRYELISNPCMMIRELKVLGRELPIGKKSEEGWQHRGFGKELIEEAMSVCTEEFNKKYLFVLSGIGVKPYYRKLGFKDKGSYLYKKLEG
jgi:elongator complex protein 3